MKITRWIAVLVILTTPALADERIEEIIVTADFRERSLMDIPSSVTALSAEEIEDAAVQHFEELIGQVPNLNWSGDGHRARYIQIRGVGELEQYQGAPNPSVGFLIDDIDFSGIGTIATLFDVGSVQILRGPQSGRYGANALGGLIYLTSTPPGSDSGSRLEVSAGDDSMRALGLAVGGNLGSTETFPFRFSLHQHESDGFRRNSFLGRDDTNGRDELSARFGLEFQPTAATDARLAVIYSDIDNGYDAFAIDNSYTMLSDKPGRDAQESLGLSLRLETNDVAGGQLTSITSAAGSDIVFSFDADWGNDESWAPVTYDYTSVSLRDRRTLSQEFRYSRGDWLFGVYALRLDDDLATDDQGTYFDPGFNFADSLNAQFSSRYTSTSIALFSQYVRDIGDGLQLTASLRAEQRGTDYEDSDGLVADPTDSLWGGELAISKDLSDDATGYVSLSRGFKAGGFNVGVVPAALREFSDEGMWTLESGYKYRNGVLAVNAAVFHAWRDDQQVRSSFQLDPNNPASFGFATVNVDGAKNYGLEADASLAISDVLSIRGSLGLLYGDFPDSLTRLSNLSGREQAHAPNYTASLGLRYASEAGFYADASLNAIDAFYFDVSHDQRSEAYELVNLKLGYDADRWSVSLWARNLFDQDYAVRGFFFGNEPPNFVPALYTRRGDPRHVGLTFTWRFEE